MLRHFAAFVLSAATVVAAHFVLPPIDRSTVDRAGTNSRLLSRIYDLRGIEAAAARNFKRIPAGKPYYAHGFNGRTEFVDPAIPPTTSEYDESLFGAIENVIDPDSWRVNGGSIGSATWIDGRLLVTQTAGVHAQIRELLDAMEALCTAEAPPESP